MMIVQRKINMKSYFIINMKTFHEEGVNGLFSLNIDHTWDTRQKSYYSDKWDLQMK